jgi:hypothetical protein
MTDTTPTHLHVTVGDGGEKVTFFLPHYFSTSCLHELHETCKGKCKFCEERCRCPCHAVHISAPRDSL